MLAWSMTDISCQAIVVAVTMRHFINSTSATCNFYEDYSILKKIHQLFFGIIGSIELAVPLSSSDVSSTVLIFPLLTFATLL